MQHDVEQLPITTENIHKALLVLQHGDHRLLHADHYLAQARASPQVWQVLPALLASTSQTSLLFGAQALYTRIRSDWLALDDNIRSSAVSLAVEALLSHSLAQQTQANCSSVVHYLGKALGCAVSMSPQQFQEPLWEMLVLKLQGRRALKCDVMAAIATELDHNATSHVANHVQIRAFCRSRAHQVVPDAIYLLNSVRNNETVSEECIKQLRVAVQCLQSWTPYADKAQVADALLKVIGIPQLAGSVTEALNEIVGYSGTSLPLLLCTARGLTAAFHAARGPDMHIVHHAISEVVCSLSEWNADELMEQQTDQSRVVIHTVIELLWICLNVPDKASFFAAIEGWMAWVAADHLMQADQPRLGVDRVSAVLSVVIQRMESLSFVRACFEPELDEEDGDDEKGPVVDLLCVGSLSIGHYKYILLTSKFLSEASSRPPGQICATLEALAASTASTEDDEIDEHDWKGVREVLETVIRLVESGAAGSIQNGDGHPWQTVLRSSGLKALASYTLLLVKDDKLFYRSAVCAVRALQQPELARQGACLLRNLGEVGPNFLVQFLQDLIMVLNHSVTKMSVSAAEEATYAVASIACKLETRGERVSALEELVRKACERLCVAARGKDDLVLNEASLCRDLILLSTAVRVYNDQEAAVCVFQRIRDAVFQLCRRHCANGVISKAICTLLEVNASPTLLDEDDEVSDECVSAHDEKCRLAFTVSVLKLVAECFKRSGPDGENAWLKTMNKLVPDLVTGMEDNMGVFDGDALDCVRECVQCAVVGLKNFSSENFDTQPEMTRLVFKLVTTLTTRASGTVLPLASEISHTAMRIIQSSEVGSVKAGLSFWKALFSRRAGAMLQQTVLNVTGGPNAIAAGALCAARYTRCASDAADVLFAMCRIIAGQLDEKQMLRECLRSAFGMENVPKEGLERSVREMLFRGCYSSVGNKKEFRKALDKVGRVCGMTNT
ncbi:hypothetical protein BWQ96_00316 [Gracilariopsis chorda]|uniref:Importin-13 n=1 Tax=Gracilariopsis chorda TaxID=448386 RepID=A0A2V3J6U8_9FLOR|nr:hypothetical protein BWQ96_00316 [Gracilariopsis chorda]|eukprot:PXF50156.1 hypothetical protein BWQ96_00316 [Gracilariopsis chorda]